MENSNARTLVQSLVLLLTCFSLAVCTARDSITFTQPLKDPEILVSLNQTFKLGFFSPPNTTNRYVGIMFNLPVQTVIWVANREKPLNDSAGTFRVSEDGNLVVLNGPKEILWTSNVSKRSANCTAKLLDTGNLVLQENGRIIWESFENPTDSFVQTMRIRAASLTNEKLRLRSWRSPSDPSPGDFSAGLELLQTAQALIWRRSKIYWRSGPWNGNMFIGLQDAKSVVTNSVYNNGIELGGDSIESAYVSFKYSNGLALLYYQLTSEGTLLEKFWREGNKDWEVTSSTKETECDEYGKCGPFGSCNTRDSSSICKCLKGFEPRDKEEWDRGNWTGGCTRKRPLQCGRNVTSAKDKFLRLSKMKVPNFVEWVSNSEDNCESLCLENCSCLAYAYYKGLGCMHWSGNLIDIQKFQSGGADLHIRVSHFEPDDGKDMKGVIAGSVVGFLVVAGSLLACWKLLAKHKGKKQQREQSLFQTVDEYRMGIVPPNKFKQATLMEELTLYSYESLSNATKDFSCANKLGKGGFGQVYKGVLEDGQEIAVKRLSKYSGQGINEFMNEVVVISKLQHRNLVRLLGCCVEREEKMLIYEYMPNGSLDAYLFDSSKKDLLNWSRRSLIIQGIGRGLLYLHRDSRLKIIHRDLKASNILLDEDLNPKISDFGLAKILGGKQDEDNTRRVVGTYGYMSPEYAMVGKFSEKSDVYSFGVLLLEIVTGRRNSCFSHGEDELSLLRYAWKLWNEGDAVKVTDPSVYEPSIEMEMLRYIHVGLLCVQENERDRPNVSAILSMLNNEISQLPHPKLPAFTGTVVYLGSESSRQQSGHSINDYTLTVMEAR